MKEAYLLRIRKNIKKHLEIEAKRIGISMNAVITTAIIEYLNSKAKTKNNQNK